MVSAAFAPSKAPVAIPVREILPWAVFAGLLCLLALYFVGAEQGATSIFPGMYIHEFVHDGRHLLVAQVVHSAGYNLLSFTRAFAVVKCQSALACLPLRTASHAWTSSFNTC